MAGDRITAVNGAEVAGLAELYGALSARAGRESVLTVLRGGVEIDVRPDDAGADLNAREGAPGGAELIEIPDIRPDDPAIRVTIDAGSLAGPSAGLPLALHLYEELTGESLTGARRIAATGTIEPTGEVGAVGGVALKAIAASRAGAELFLVPEANLAEAAEAAEAGGGGMAVAGVGTLEEAISLLRAGPDQAR
jgi:PDZ domain-containing protein